MAQSPALKPEDNRILGGLVVAFGCLEHELIRAAIGICGGPNYISAHHKQKIENVLENGAGLSSRLEVFCGLARKYKIHSKDEIDQFEDKIREGVQWRNMICHGSWRRLPTGKLEVTFYKKGCVTAEAPDVAEFTSIQLIEMAEITFENAKTLSSYIK